MASNQLALQTIVTLFAFACMKYAEAQLLSESRVGSIGTAKVTEYAWQRMDHDKYAFIDGTMCAKVTYNSMYIAPMWVEKEVRDRSTFHVAHTGEGPLLYMLASSNYRGKRSPYNLTRPLTAYMMGFDNIDEEMYACVDLGQSEHTTQPEISVDWYVGLSFNGFGAPTVAKLRTFERASSQNRVVCETYRRREQGIVLIGTYIVNQKDSPMVSHNVVSWVDSFDELDVKYCFFWSTAVGSAHASRMNATIAYISTAHPDSGHSIARGTIGEATMDYLQSGLQDVVCIDISFYVRQKAVPYVFINLAYKFKSIDTEPEPPARHWVDYVTLNGFRACIAYSDPTTSHVQMNESLPFLQYVACSIDGCLHDNPEFESRANKMIKVTWNFPEAYDFSLVQNGFPGKAYVFTSYVDFLGDRHTSRNWIYYPQAGYYVDASNRRIIGVVHVIMLGGDRVNALVSDINKSIREFNYKLTYNDDYNQQFYRAMIDQIYPEGSRTPANQLADVKIEYADWCALKPYSAGACSVRKCGDGATGIQSLTRGHYGSRMFCDTLQIKRQCNLPPCSISEGVARYPYVPSSPVMPAEFSGSLNIILGVVAAAVIGIGIIALILYLLRRDKSSVCPKNSVLAQSAPRVSAPYHTRVGANELEDNYEDSGASSQFRIGKAKKGAIKGKVDATNGKGDATKGKGKKGAIKGKGDAIKGKGDAIKGKGKKGAIKGKDGLSYGVPV